MSPCSLKVSFSHPRKAFTLIELLVVIAIIAILSIVVVLTLNPAQLLAQSRDSNRVSDMATLNSALGIYAAQGGNALGNANTVYVSIPDLSATSTAGDNCQGLGLPALPASDTYFCAASSSYRQSNGTGWIPVNFSNLAAGSPLSILPQDPVNTSSSGFYYTYATNGNQYQLTTHFESQKYIPMEATSGGSDPAMYTMGSNLALAPYAGDMVGWWPLNEGSGSTALDMSGAGNNGIWVGTASGTAGTYYKAGNNQAYAGYFDGNTDYVQIPDVAILNLTKGITVSMWLDQTVVGGNLYPFYKPSQYAIGTGGVDGSLWNSSVVRTNIGSGGWSTNQWNFVVLVSDGVTARFYINGSQVASTPFNFSLASDQGSPLGIGTFIPAASTYAFPGFIDDVRMYNRALSASEISAIYAAGK